MNTDTEFDFIDQQPISCTPSKVKLQTPGFHFLAGIDFGGRLTWAPVSVYLSAKAFGRAAVLQSAI
jgi:hypothetical protein